MYRRECQRWGGGRGAGDDLKYDMFYIWDHYMEWWVGRLDVRGGGREDGGWLKRFIVLMRLVGLKECGDWRYEGRLEFGVQRLCGGDDHSDAVRLI